MLEQNGNRKTGANSSTSEFDDLIESACAVVRTHDLRDADEASDEDVSDAIADLEGCLALHHKGTRPD